MASGTKGVVTSRAAQAEKTRKHLLSTAVRLFSERSYSDVAVADIAKEAGVAHGLIFHHFNNKRGIYLAAIQQAGVELDNAFEIDPALPPDEQMRSALGGHLQFLAAHRGLALRLVLGGRGADPDAWDVFESSRGQAIIKASVLMGLDPDNPAVRMTARAATGAIDEACVFWLENEQPFPISSVVDTMIRIILGTVSAATVLDPSLDTSAAIEILKSAQSVGTPVGSEV